MKVIHNSPLRIPQEEVILQECTWGGFRQILLSTIPMESGMVDFWDNILKRHHKVEELFRNEYTLYNFTLSYQDLVWLGKQQYGDPDKQSVKDAVELMKLYGIFITIGDNEVVELRLLDYRYLRKSNILK